MYISQLYLKYKVFKINFSYFLFRSYGRFVLIFLKIMSYSAPMDDSSLLYLIFNELMQFVLIFLFVKTHPLRGQLNLWKFSLLPPPPSCSIHSLTDLGKTQKKFFFKGSVFKEGVKAVLIRMAKFQLPLSYKGGGVRP